MDNKLKKKLWNAANEADLINFFKENPCLWDNKHPDYENRKDSPLLDVFVERQNKTFTGIFYYYLFVIIS